MKYLILTCPPLPHFIVGGECMLRPGDLHERRIIYRTFDLLYVIEGVLHLYQDEQNFTLNPGQFLIIFPNTQHKGSAVCSETTHYAWLHFYTTGEFSYADEPYVERAPRKANPTGYYKKSPFHISIPRYGVVPKQSRMEFESLLGALHQVSINKYEGRKEYRPIQHSELYQQLVFIQLLHLLCQPYSARENTNVAERLHQYLEAHYTEPVLINDLQSMFSYSVSHMIRAFKKTYQISPKQYLMQLRLQAAARQLMQTDLPISQICEECGFHSVSFFTQQFKQFTGVTPAKYRKNPQPIEQP